MRSQEEKKKMELKVPDIEDLVKFNGYLNRRLYVVYNDKDEFALIDGEGEIIKATMICSPRVVTADIRDYNPNLPWTDQRPYWFSTVQPYLWQEWLTRSEARLVLGKDCDFESNSEDINAICETSTGGPGLANAYVLGDRYSGMHSEHSRTIIPVQYYKINSKRHKELGIKSDKNKLKYLVSCVEEERKR